MIDVQILSGAAANIAIVVGSFTAVTAAVMATIGVLTSRSRKTHVAAHAAAKSEDTRELVLR
jgi:hypothetical protein